MKTPESVRGAPEDRLLSSVGYIEAHIGGSIALRDIAASSGLSKHHFHRLFRARFGMPVMDYVRRRRLAQAAERLVESDVPIIEIALEAGFDSQAAFTRAFRRLFHRAPAAYRVQSRNVPWLAASAIRAETLAALPGLGVDSPSAVNAAVLRLVGIEAVFSAAERGTIPRLWKKLGDALGASAAGNADGYGVAGDGPEVFDGVLHYMAAVASAPLESVPDGLILREVPAGRYLVFPFQGRLTRLPDAIDYLHSVWIQGSAYSPRLGPALERYPSAFSARRRSEVIEIWIPVK